MATDKRLAVLSLSHGKPILMRAGYRDGLLVVVESKELPPDMRTIQNLLPGLLTKFKQKGYVLIVDEVISYFGAYGRPLRLEDTGSTGKPVLVSALEAYKSMDGYNMLQFSKGVVPIDIPDSIVEEEKDRDGRAVFNIDWDQLSPDSAALLLLVYAAVNDSFFDSSTANAMFAALRPSKSKQPAKSFQAALMRLDVQKTKAVTGEK
ncbi:hypothetical protein I6Y99_004341 [Vibrio parahaemolyticus]|uniref:hypothetical protein n=1 Tax=Vibrio parahaemolyticus TaxID=670 RepID=UPI0011AF2408|nr:hypothetical protein [Vibrio parahaemolyticus]EGQ7810300.1 hypothetical protein [Vibrio parahaemolyticus]HBN6266145.1 hypothetical protein [Vibrio parahaemolyticus]